MKHCCKNMEWYLEENEVDIYYEAEFRCYYIGMKNGTSAVQTIHYCPWCGSKFPANFNDLWFEILEKEYGIECPYDEEEEHKVPAEFKTDEWWKKRGL